MVVITITCAHCGSPDIVKNGHAPNGKQKYRCRACGRQSRDNPTPHVTPQERREEILRAYQERRVADRPALVLWGDRDPYLPVRYAERQRAFFSRAEVHLLADSGHWPHVDNPEAVADLVVPFLARQLVGVPTTQQEVAQ
jgi:pimeloyl-ACP methyl ester carboxylesterase